MNNLNLSDENITPIFEEIKHLVNNSKKTIYKRNDFCEKDYNYINMYIFYCSIRSIFWCYNV